MTRFATLLLLLATLPALARTPLPPVDEAARDPGFFSFRAQFLAALARRDVDAVLAVVDPDIKNSFGGDDGRDEFIAAWRLREPDSPFWETMAATLALGGTLEGGDGYTAPYLFTRWPGELDAFDHVAVVGTKVRLRAAPAPEAAVLATLSFEAVALDHEAPATPGWTAVRLDDGRGGYIADRYLRSPIDYRALFRRVDGRWRLVVFIAGD